MQHGGLGLRSAAGHAHAAYCGQLRHVTRGNGKRLRSSCSILLVARTSPPQEDSEDDEPADLTRGW